MKKFTPLIVAVSALTIVLAGCSGGSSGGDASSDAGGDGQQVFMLLPNSTTTRFEARDAPYFEEALATEAPDAELTVLNAEGDPAKQQQQVEDAITQGASVIVLVSADANLAAGSLALADQAGVPVVLYDHDAIGGPAAAQVVFDSLAVGEEQGARAAELAEAMEGEGLKVARIMGNPGEYGTEQYTKGQNEHLQPLIDSGKIEVVCEQNITNWDPVVGQAFMEDCLAQQSNDLDLIVAMNDGLAGASIAALTTQGLEGTIPVTAGQDATVESLNYIVQGFQDSTVFKDLRLQAEGAAKITAALLRGEEVPEDLINGEVDNDFQMVPAMFLPVSNVTIDNIQDVVDAGVWTWEQICQGAEETEVCVENLP
ncbi:monosaccharide ABC transporter substrate-binding protein (CUT2 family) [Microcella alkaliphila]|uniref:Monosaccharide ABC transporter substrate-binding protein (CUT2 family) n=1 Tax=Microcella alkaliphila TaxID=279828 RepID=A0A4Q7TZ67_9MICO|nr:sugar ABC transporter substrate-binding protein [Microcella alkaliphila]RZT66471.1 monosaccharide ABC transporter substrate-binding protein (CUT2 family) [Microcella alkaliphila]